MELDKIIKVLADSTVSKDRFTTTIKMHNDTYIEVMQVLKQVKNTVDLADVSKCDNPHCEYGIVGEVYGEKMYCSKCEDK